MNLPPARIDYIIEKLRECTRALLDNFDDDEIEEEARGSSPDLLADALFHLLDVLKQLECLDHVDCPSFDAHAYPGTYPRLENTEEISELADYGIHLLRDLSSWANRLNLQDACSEIEVLSLSLALWTSERGGEVRTLEPLVNGFAFLANRTRDPNELEQLFNATGKVIHSVAIEVSDAEDDSFARPWRILVINRAIVATRTRRPALMREAFDDLVEQLPDDAPAFFREGMEQMDLVGYPDRVKEVMAHYANLWSAERILH